MAKAAKKPSITETRKNLKAATRNLKTCQKEYNNLKSLISQYKKEIRQLEKVLAAHQK